MRNLLALLLFVPSLCLAQLPDYLPSEGLVAWYPFNGNANDQSGNGNDGVVTNATLTQDRMGEENSAFFFDGNGFIEIESLNAMDYNPITYSAWVIDSTEYLDTTNFHARTIMGREQSGYYHQGAICYYNEPAAGVVNQLNYYIGNPSFPDIPVANYPYVIGSWTHLVFSLTDNGEFSWFLNGALTNTGTLSVEQYVELPFRIGSSFNRFFWFGMIDDCGIWDRTLNSTEVLALYTGTPLAFGCTNASACNYDPMANSDDGSCASCEVLATACGEGTVWDSTLQKCVTDLTFPTAPCGEGTVWDPVNEECIIAIPADLNLDGCVTTNDLLMLLTAHGSCPPVPFADPCGDESALTYHGYDYDIVAIGNQCWFAENLRTDQFTDGSAIAEMLGDSLWWATEPAQSYFDQDTNLLAIRGRLYNGHAVMDERGLCPSGWHVPADQEFMALETATGMPEDELDTTDGFRGCSASVGDGWKSSSGWLAQDGGTDLWGLAVGPSGYYTTPDGFGNAFVNAELWSSTIDVEGKLWRRQVPADSGCLFRNSWDVHVGSAIRCVKD